MRKFTDIHTLAEEKYPKRAAIAYKSDDFKKIAKSGKRVIMIGVENGYPIGMDINNVKKFYDLGTRYITLSHSGDNQICTSAGSGGIAGDTVKTGLSEFGKQVVAEMNLLGIMVDVSHISVKSFWDAIEYSKAPIIASHSGCRALCDVGRDLDDEQLKALAKNGGVIQIVALASYLKGNLPERNQAIRQMNEEIAKVMVKDKFQQLGRQELAALTPARRTAYNKRNEKYTKMREAKMPEIDAQFPPPVGRAELKDFVDHIDYAVKIAGIDHVGIGTDFDGGGGVPGFNDHSECLNVTVELLKRGYTEQDIQKIWGGNLLRVWKEVELKAKELQKAKAQ